MKRVEPLLRILLFILCLLPSLLLAWGYYRQDLGINPFAKLAQTTGQLALTCLIISLAVTPVRRWLTIIFCMFPSLRWGKRLSDWNILIRMRRMVGLYSFYYASLHFWVYLYLEMDFYWKDILLDVLDRQPVIIGLITWLGLLVLSLTSLDAIRKKMRIWWRRTHRLVYPISLLAVLHYAFVVKATNSLPYLYLVIVSVLLIHRILVVCVRKLRNKKDTGMEVWRS